jgi:6-phosphogluconate dehydrogenase
MGSNMVQRLMKAGHECVVSDTRPQAVKDVVAKGAKSSDSIAGFVKKLTKPRAVWMMVPAAVVDSVLTSLKPVLEPGDIIDTHARPLLVDTSGSDSLDSGARHANCGDANRCLRRVYDPAGLALGRLRLGLRPGVVPAQ